MYIWADPGPPGRPRAGGRGLAGGAGPEFSYQALNQAFGHLQRGARLVAMHRGLYWRTSEGLQLDAGAFLAGLEQAAGTEAEVVGKPAPEFFVTALSRLGASAAGTVMVGDDLDTDVLAAQHQGLTGVLVKTGKYLPRTHHTAAGTPTTSWTLSPACPPCWSNCREMTGETTKTVTGSMPVPESGRRPVTR